MKKVLWFSRHEMTREQFSDLQRFYGEIEISQVDATIPNVHVPFEGANGESYPAFKELVKGFDVVAIVAPINLQQQVLAVAGDRPVIVAKNRRVAAESRDGEQQYQFIHEAWYRLVEIKVNMEVL